MKTDHLDKGKSPDSPASVNIWRLVGWPAVVLTLLVVAGRYAGKFWPDVEAAVGGLGFWGYLLFIAAWVLLSLTFFPVSVLGVSAGALFGPWVGMALRMERINPHASKRYRFFFLPGHTL